MSIINSPLAEYVFSIREMRNMLFESFETQAFPSDGYVPFQSIIEWFKKAASLLYSDNPLSVLTLVTTKTRIARMQEQTFYKCESYPLVTTLYIMIAHYFDLPINHVSNEDSCPDCDSVSHFSVVELCKFQNRRCKSIHAMKIWFISSMVHEYRRPVPWYYIGLKLITLDQCDRFCDRLEDVALSGLLRFANKTKSYRLKLGSRLVRSDFVYHFENYCYFHDFSLEWDKKLGIIRVDVIDPYSTPSGSRRTSSYVSNRTMHPVYGSNYEVFPIYIKWKEDEHPLCIGFSTDGDIVYFGRFENSDYEFVDSLCDGDMGCVCYGAVCNSEETVQDKMCSG